MEMDRRNEPDIDLNHQLLTIIKNHDVFTDAAIGNAMILLLEQMSESTERDEDDDDMPSNIRKLNTDGFLVRIPVPLPIPSYAQSLFLVHRPSLSTAYSPARSVYPPFVPLPRG